MDQHQIKQMAFERIVTLLERGLDDQEIVLDLYDSKIFAPLSDDLLFLVEQASEFLWGGDGWEEDTTWNIYS